MTSACRDRRDHRPLRTTFLRLVPLSLFHDARLEPFLYQADHAPVSDPMFHKLNQPTMLDFVEGFYDTLPIIRTFPRQSRLSVLDIHSKVNHSRFLGPFIGTADCISF